jgi:hypothetical protein
MSRQNLAWAALALLFAASWTQWGQAWVTDERLDTALTALEGPDTAAGAEAALDAYQGTSDPSVVALYNQGVLHHRLGDVPSAIAHWRAAWDLAPRDGDIAHNLAVARTELTQDPPIPVGFALPWMAILTPLEVGGLAMLAWLGCGLLQQRRAAFVSQAGAGILALVLTWAALQGRQAWLTSPTAVVMEDALRRDTPSFQASGDTPWPPGTEVRVHGHHSGFVLVEDGEGHRGWLVRAVLAVPGTSWR